MQPFFYARTGLHFEPQQEAEAQTTRNTLPLSPQWQQTLRYGAIGLSLALVALWPTVFDLALQWSNSKSYQYAWLVLPVFIYVAGWYHRDSILAMTPRPAYGGLLLIVAATPLWVAAFVADVKFGQHIALVVVLQGIALVPMVALATAHAAKFPDAVEDATGVRPALPDHLSDLFEREERCTQLANDLDAVKAYVSEHALNGGAG